MSLPVSETVELPDRVVALLKDKVFAYLSTLLADGSPHATETWIDTDGTHILVNTVEGYQKLRNVRRDPRVALVVSRPEDPARNVAVRGEVVSATTEGARAHIEALSEQYFGGPYPYHHLGDRVLLRIAPTWVHDRLER